jgi:hypothetical protein
MRPCDNFAAEMIPIRLIISVAIIAAIAVLVWAGMGVLRTSLGEHEVEQQCQQLQSTLCTMVQSGVARDLDECNAAEGTKRMHTFTLPDSLVYLSFGGDPDARNTGVLHPGLTEDGSAIFYKIQGGSKKVIWLPEGSYRFRDGRWSNGAWTLNEEGCSYIIHHGGSIPLEFELVQKNHVVYILVHGNDEIEK